MGAPGTPRVRWASVEASAVGVAAAGVAAAGVVAAGVVAAGVAAVAAGKSMKSVCPGVDAAQKLGASARAYPVAVVGECGLGGEGATMADSTNPIIAVAAMNDMGLEAPVSAHFGHAPYFVFVQVGEEGALSGESEANPFAASHAPGQLPEWLGEKRVSAILAGGMGGGAIDWFSRLGITAVTGCSGSVKEAVGGYLAGRLHGASGCSGHEDHGCEGGGHG